MMQIPNLRGSTLSAQTLRYMAIEMLNYMYIQQHVPTYLGSVEDN